MEEQQVSSQGEQALGSPGHDAPDVLAGDGYDEPREPYTRARFLKELGIAAAILAVGLPVVLLLAPDPQPVQSTQPALAQPPAVAATRNPTPRPTASPALDARPVLLVSADLELPLAQQLVGAAVQRAGSQGSAVVQPGKGFTSGQPSLATLAAGGVPSPEVAMVAVQAGGADLGGGPGAAREGALLVADRLRAVVSGSTALTLIGPVPEGEPTPALLRVRDEVRAAAREKSLHFVDPVELGLRQGQPDLASALGAALGRFIRPAGS